MNFGLVALLCPNSHVATVDTDRAIVLSEFVTDTYWFGLVHLILTSHSCAPLHNVCGVHIGAHRASQIARRINELCERATIMIASWFWHRWIWNKNAHRISCMEFSISRLYFISESRHITKNLYTKKCWAFFARQNELSNVRIEYTQRSVIAVKVEL